MNVSTRAFSTSGLAQLGIPHTHTLRPHSDFQARPIWLWFGVWIAPYSQQISRNDSGVDWIQVLPSVEELFSSLIQRNALTLHEQLNF